MAVIEAKRIYHTYNGKDMILNGIDVTVDKGEFVSVLGASVTVSYILTTVKGRKEYKIKFSLSDRTITDLHVKPPLQGQTSAKTRRKFPAAIFSATRLPNASASNPKNFGICEGSGRQLFGGIPSKSEPSASVFSPATDKICRACARSARRCPSAHISLEDARFRQCRCI